MYSNHNIKGQTILPAAVPFSHHLRRKKMSVFASYRNNHNISQPVSDGNGNIPSEENVR
jgi:hypothetical protein